MFCCSSRDDGKKSSGSMPRHPVHNDAPLQSGAPPGQAGKPVGVGIVFQPDSSGALHVKSLAVGGPADISGLVKVGDVLHEIDSHHVYRKPVGQLAPLILGQEGTAVELRRGWTLQQGQPQGAPVPAGAAPAGKAWTHQLPQGAKLSHFSGPTPGGQQ